jgi:hypothetical protein
MARNYACVSPRFWIGETGRSLRGKPNLQVMLMYLITSPNSNLIGLYYLAIPIMAHETGLTPRQVRVALDQLAAMDVAFYDAHQELVYVPTMVRFQTGDRAFKKEDNIVKGIRRELEQFRRHPFGQDFVRRYNETFALGFEAQVAGTETGPRAVHLGSRGDPFEGPSEGSRDPSDALEEGLCCPEASLRNQDQEQEQDQDQEHPPLSSPRSSDPDSDAGTRVAPSVPAASISGHALCVLFGEVRSREVGGLPWQAVRVANGKASEMADLIASDPGLLADVKPTMELLFKRAKTGKAGKGAEQILRDPSFAFGAWCSSWTALREELHGRAPLIPKAIASPPESFAERDARAREERRAREKAESARNIAATNRKAAEYAEWEALEKETA